MGCRFLIRHKGKASPNLSLIASGTCQSEVSHVEPEDSHSEEEEDQVSEQVAAVESSTDNDESHTPNESKNKKTKTGKKRKYHQIAVSKIRQEFCWIDESVVDFMWCKFCHSKVSGSRFHLKRHENSKMHKKTGSKDVSEVRWSC